MKLILKKYSSIQLPITSSFQVYFNSEPKCNISYIHYSGNNLIEHYVINDHLYTCTDEKRMFVKKIINQNVANERFDLTNNSNQDIEIEIKEEEFIESSRHFYVGVRSLDIFDHLFFYNLKNYRYSSKDLIFIEIKEGDFKAQNNIMMKAKPNNYNQGCEIKSFQINYVLFFSNGIYEN